MKFLTHPACTAFGLSVLCCLVLISPLITSDHILIFHNSGASSAIFLPVLLDVAIVWVLITLLLLRARRAGRLRVFLWSGIILFFPWLLLEDGALLRAWNVHRRLGIALLLWSCACWISVNVFWRPGLVPHFERLVGFWRSAFAFLAVNNILVIGQLLWCFWQVRDINVPRPLHVHAVQAGAAQMQRPRVVWIILDELSYQQVYERRYPALALPAFDRLARQSTVFTHVVPAGAFTEEVVPSLLTGRPVGAVRITSDGLQLSMYDPATTQWTVFRPEDSIFQDAIQEGYSTGVAGWYNPYCRFLAQVLDHCFWTFRQNDDNGIFAERSIVSNTVGPLVMAASSLAPGITGNPYDAHINDAHIADYRDLSAAADGMLSDSSINFLLLHMPIPHPAGIYDRRTGAFKDLGASYIDNLSLADGYLAHVMQLLQQRGEWDSSAVIVMGDHSWRTTRLWESSSFWMPEEQAASGGGRFDDRPGYIVKLPGQSQGARFDAAYPATETHAMLEGILDGSIRTPAQLASFAQQHPPAGPDLARAR